MADRQERGREREIGKERSEGEGYGPFSTAILVVSLFNTYIICSQ